jgi:hypothetical protein
MMNKPQYLKPLTTAVSHTTAIRATHRGIQNRSQPRYLTPWLSKQHITVFRTTHTRSIWHRTYQASMSRFSETLTAAVSHTAVIEATHRGIQNRWPPRCEIPRLSNKYVTVLRTVNNCGISNHDSLWPHRVFSHHVHRKPRITAVISVTPRCVSDKPRFCWKIFSVGSFWSEQQWHSDNRHFIVIDVQIRDGRGDNLKQRGGGGALHDFAVHRLLTILHFFKIVRFLETSFYFFKNTFTSNHW